MQKLKTSLQELYYELEKLSQSIGSGQEEKARQLAKQAEALKISRAREANNLAIAQKVASRLDHGISRLERMLRESNA